jgi:dTDP-4-amino-4,6-dideoxygalactose transaminase
MKKKIPIMRPLLPKAEKILPFLQEIDENRWYSNFGPLTFRFEEKLAEMFGITTSALITASSGTAAMSVLLRAMNIETGTFCVVPSWTFVATAAAAVEAGLVPYFVDVDNASWVIEPEELKQQLRLIPGKVGAVIVVSAFGHPISVSAWDRFTEETGIPVIIDGAAAFDTVLQHADARMGNTPVMVSLHATKTFGIGEGGIVISQNKQMLHKARQLTNFGFAPSRDIVLPGVNAKLSEYSAAIGLAAIDGWPEKRAQWRTVSDQYIEAFAHAKCPTVSHRLSSDWVSSTCNVQVPPNCVENIIEQLSYSGIEARKWWVKGCHKQPAYAHYSRFALPVTEALSDTVMALPFSADLTQEEISYIVKQFTSLF